MPQFIASFVIQAITLALRLAGILIAAMIPFGLAAFVEMTANPASWSIFTRLAVAILWLLLVVGLAMFNAPRGVGK